MWLPKIPNDAGISRRRPDEEDNKHEKSAKQPRESRREPLCGRSRYSNNTTIYEAEAKPEKGWTKTIRRLKEAVCRATAGLTTRRLLVAVSGGADSLCLLHLLHETDGLEVVACHVDHRLRPESKEEARLVEHVANQWGIDCIVKRVDTCELMQREALSMESAARTLRYQALRSAASKLGVDAIALGHTSDDQAETVLMRVFRGAGISGLASMRMLQGDLFRPLLGTSHAETVAYCEALGVHYVDDPLNRDLTILRNRVRLELLPAISEVFPGARQALLRLAESSARDADYLEDLSREALARISPEGEIVPELWADLPASLQLHSLRLLSEGSGRPVTSRDLETQAESLRSRVKAEAARSWLVLPGFDSHASAEVGPVSRTALVVPGRTMMDGAFIDSTLLDRSDRVLKKAVVASPNDAYLDGAVVGHELHVRGWRAADRMQPLGLKGKKKLQDIFVDKKIPRTERDRLWVVEDRAGIVWVAGVAIDDRAQVTETTNEILHLSANSSL